MDAVMRDETQTAIWDDEGGPADAESDVVSGAGGWIVDMQGRRLFDAGSGHSCVNLGYANEELIEAATRSFRTLAYCSPEHRCRPVVALAATLNRLLGGGYRIRYATTGGAANELAIEIARRYWRHLGRPEKRKIIAFDCAYHGSTGAASFASGPGVLQSPLVDRSAEFVHVAGARDLAAGVDRDLSAIEQGVERAIAAAGAETVAAVIVEPVAFAGGVVVPPPGFLTMLARLCAQRDLLLIVDEIITGFGRSGRWFAFQHADGVRPDIVTMAKGLTSAYYPLSATAVSERIHDTFTASGNAMSKVITMAGHPVGCDIALKVIEIMERDGLPARVARNAERLAALHALRDLPTVRDVRGLGHMWGIEFGGADIGGSDFKGADLAAASAEARAIAGRCLDAGLQVLQDRNIIRINPPLTSTEDEIAFVADALVAAART